MIKDPDTVYFWWNSSYVFGVKFVKWVITRMNTGGSDTNKLSVAVMVESDWLFNSPVVKVIPNGCKRGQYILRPHTDLYRSYNNARMHKGIIRKPSVEEIRSLK